MISKTGDCKSLILITNLAAKPLYTLYHNNLLSTQSKIMASICCTLLDVTTIPASISTIKDIESSPGVLCNQTGRRFEATGQHFVARMAKRHMNKSGKLVP